MKGKTAAVFKVEHEELFKSIRSGVPLINDYGAKSTMTAVLGQLACYSGKSVAYEEAMKSDFTFGPKEASLDMEPPKKPNPDGNYPLAVPGKTKVI